MIPKPLVQVTEADLQALITAHVRESKTIEYKRDLPGGSDEQKREFLADVSSFANASGGDLIFGMDAAGGLPTVVVGFGVSDIDAEVQRLNSILQSGLDPRLPSVETRAISLASGQHALVIRVRQSWIAPHRVVYRDHSKFYGRNSTGKYPLDVGELRTAFTLSEGIAERIRRFREDRLSKIAARETPVALRPGAIAVLHVVPLASFSTAIAVSFDDPYVLLRVAPPNASGAMNYRRNLDGHLNFTGDIGGASRAYTQCFRNGVIEFVAVSGDGIIRSASLEQGMFRSFGKALQFFGWAGIEPPTYVLMSLLDVKGHRLGVGNASLAQDDPVPVDRNMLILPEIVVDDFSVAPETAMRPLFDMIWNAWGYARSFNYGPAGDWRG